MDIKNLFFDFPSEDDLLDIIMHTSTTAWEDEVGERDIEKWLNNFNGEVYDLKYERQLALWLLCHFTYYNKHEVNHLCSVLYHEFLHLIISEVDKSLSDVENKILQFFRKSNIISSEVTSGSGGFIAYIFRQVNSLPIKGLFNFSLDNISDNIENIIVIDDVTLTSGEDGQMYSFWNRAKTRYPDKNFYLLTLIASEDSLDFLKNKFKLNIVSAIKLDKRDQCFANESDVFSSFLKLIPIAKKFAEHYGTKIGVTYPLGFKNGQYTFGFYYNTPDNALPIFWGQINGWTPILKRHHKNYRDEKYLNYEKFV